jgi:hypothetical protein
MIAAQARLLRRESMARIIFAIRGYLLLPGIWGAVGGAIGGYVGGVVDQQIFGSGTPEQTSYGVRLQDLRVQSSSYGGLTRRSKARDGLLPTSYG